MGDVLSFIEKAEKTIDEKKAAEVAQKMKKGLDMNDLLDQFEQIHKMGGAAGMLAMLPGGAKYADGADDAVFDRFKAIIFSMTKKEREKPQIINPQRKRRIAAGSGTTVEEVNRLLKSYEQMNKMVKQMNKKGKRRPGMGFGANLRGFGL